MPKLEEIELRVGYLWNCPKCGKIQTDEGDRRIPTEEDIAEMREERGIKSWEENELDEEDLCMEIVEMPLTVACSNCHIEYPVQQYKWHE